MKIAVINPNSSPEMTADIRAAAEAYAAGRFEAIVLSVDSAPPFIDTLEDQALAQPGMAELVRRYADEADAFVVACACDPNLFLMREIADKPVVGIGQAAMYYASQLGDSFSILQHGTYSVPNKKNLVRTYQMDRWLASVRASRTRMETFEEYLAEGRRALAEDGAEVLILGCAGLCGMAEKLSEALGCPVLDGVACGLAMAESMVNLGLKTSKIRYYSGGLSE